MLQRKALTELKVNLKIVIKPVDKRGAGAIKNTKDYLAETERHPNNNTFYRPELPNPAEDMKGKYESLNKASEYKRITTCQYEFFSMKDPKSFKLIWNLLK